jgi:hypothetical protein
MRFYFQTEDGRCYPDENGTELPDVASACIEASTVLGSFLQEKPREFWAHDNLSLKVSDQTGLVLFTLNLSVTLGPVMNGQHPRV